MEAVREEVAEKKSAYDYDKICDHFEDTSEGTTSRVAPYKDEKYTIAFSPGKRNFIQFFLKEHYPDRIRGENLEIDIFTDHALKIHINLPEEDEEMYRKGWQVAVEILTRNNVNSFKFVKRGKLMSSDEGQEGKDITIYVAGDIKNVKDKNEITGWESILNEINLELINANVPVGKQPPGTDSKQEKYFNHFKHICYRYEKDDPKWDPFEEIKFIKTLGLEWKSEEINISGHADHRDDEENVRTCCFKFRSNEK